MWGAFYKHGQTRKRDARFEIMPTIAGSIVAYPAREEDSYEVTVRSASEPSVSTGAVASFCGVTGFVTNVYSKWLYDKKMPSSGSVVIESTVNVRADIDNVV